MAQVYFAPAAMEAPTTEIQVHSASSLPTATMKLGAAAACIVMLLVVLSHASNRLPAKNTIRGLIESTIINNAPSKRIVVTSVKIEKIGSRQSHNEGSYWPVQATYTWTTTDADGGFSIMDAAQFVRTDEFIVSKNAYGEWVAQRRVGL